MSYETHGGHTLAFISYGWYTSDWSCVSLPAVRSKVGTNPCVVQIIVVIHDRLYVSRNSYTVRDTIREVYVIKYTRGGTGIFHFEYL